MNETTREQADSVTHPLHRLVISFAEVTMDIVEELKEACILAKDKRELERLCGNAASMIVALRNTLTELTAVVHGECPSLLDEDSGGDARLAMEIDKLLQKI